jgi:hypothetical protein
LKEASLDSSSPAVECKTSASEEGCKMISHEQHRNLDASV